MFDEYKRTVSEFENSCSPQLFHLDLLSESRYEKLIQRVLESKKHYFKSIKGRYWWNSFFRCLFADYNDGHGLRVILIDDEGYM